MKGTEIKGKGKIINVGRLGKEHNRYDVDRIISVEDEDKRYLIYLRGKKQRKLTKEMDCMFDGILLSKDIKENIFYLFVDEKNIEVFQFVKNEITA